MSDGNPKAIKIIQLRDREDAKLSNWRVLWQDVADLEFPREDQINTQTTPGADKSVKVYDSTAIFDSQDMTSGLSSSLFPTGQKAFGYVAEDDELNSVDVVRRYLSDASNVVRREIFKSNFMLHMNETIRSLAVFGTGCLYSEFDAAVRGLNFKDHAIGLYLIKEDSHGNVDTVILSYSFTARQAIQEFGEKEVSEDIRKDASALDTESRKWPFIHIVRPRTERNPLFSDNRNMPYESAWVDVKGKEIVLEEGFEENPYAVARWMKSSCEKYGRGQGTECLADVRMLQKMRKDYIDLCNLYVRPPIEVLQDFEGDVNLTPSGVNRVMQLNTIKGIDQTVLGNFPITEKSIEQQQELIHKAFFRDIFVQLGDLKGDRRTTVEIIERMREGLRRLASPIARLQSELLTPVLTRCLLLLIRNGRIPYPPPELGGASFGIEYTGPLALALQDQQAKGFIQWFGTVAQMAQVFPDALDIINVDSGVRDLAENFGVDVNNVASEDEVAAKRQARAQQMAAQQALQAAQVAGKTYKDASGAPEEGSPAGEFMSAMRG